MATHIANRDAASYVRRHEEFVGSNLYSVRWNEGDEYVYTVYSYGEHFPIYVFDSRTGTWLGNSGKYSMSTSRHQSQARPPHVHHYVDTATMKLAARSGVVGVLTHKILGE
jgi:hypothetical protein